MTRKLKILICSTTLLLCILNLTTAAPVGKADLLFGEEKQQDDDSSTIVRRQVSNDSSLNTTTIIIVCVVVFGIYFLILATIIGSLLICFTRCNKDKRSLRCSRKPRLSCPKLVEDNVSACCSSCVKYCCPCCSNPNNWDSGELGFWIEIVILGILCFPFALCLLILWAIATQN